MSEFQDNPDSRIGRRMLWLAAIGLLGGLYVLFAALEDGENSVRSLNTTSTTVVLKQDRSGHYEVPGLINGSPVVFLVDTGATDVALPESIARSLGLKFGPRVQVMTAAGLARAWMTRLDEVSVGGIRRFNVRATITSGEFGGVLLGMSFLKHFNLQQRDGTLVISEALAHDK